MITVETSGSFGLMEKWLDKAGKINVGSKLAGYGKQMTTQLKSSTPVDSGVTANSWDITFSSSKGEASMTVINTSENGYNVIQGLRYGHGTGTGGYVPPNDFVTPIVEPILKRAEDELAREVFE